MNRSSVRFAFREPVQHYRSVAEWVPPLKGWRGRLAVYLDAWFRRWGWVVENRLPDAVTFSTVDVDLETGDHVTRLLRLFDAYHRQYGRRPRRAYVGYDWHHELFVAARHSAAFYAAAPNAPGLEIEGVPVELVPHLEGTLVV